MSKENHQRIRRFWVMVCTLEKIKGCGTGVSLGEGGQGRLLFSELSPEMTQWQDDEEAVLETGVRWGHWGSLCGSRSRLGP